MPTPQTSFSQHEFEESLRRNPDWPVLYAEGDSWFAYPLNPAGNVIRHLAKGRRWSVLNRAKSGATAAEIFGVHQRKRFIRDLKKYPVEVLLFSGGGNDLAGNEFLLLLNEWEKGMTVEDAIDHAAAEHFVGLVRNSYEELVDVRDAHRRDALIVAHEYDLAYPDGRKALKRLGPLGIGPWLEPSLKARGIPSRKRRSITSWFLKRFKEILAEFEGPGFAVVPTQGVLDRAKRKSKKPGKKKLDVHDLWDNELHPSERGFELIADEFLKVLRKRLPERFGDA